MNALAEPLVTHQIPPYLKLHNENSSEPEAGQPDEWTTLAEAIGTAIGWQVDVISERAEGEEDATLHVPLTLGAPLWLEEQSDGDVQDAPADEQTEGPPASSPGGLGEAAASALLDAFNHVCGELRRTRRALWEREAELAAAVPVTPRPDEEMHLADRLEAILRGGAEAVKADAAALYLLNDDTTHLKVRACWGLPQDRLLDEPRPLRGAVADLEALVGHAVVLEDTALLAHWKVPEEGFPTALCVPVSSPTSPLGTLWLFCNEQRDFSPAQTNMVEIVAGRLASDLDREVLLHEGVSGQDLRRQRDTLAATQFERLPSVTPLLDEWDVAGWTTPCDEVMGDFYDWCVLPDGRLALAVGDAMGRGLEAALTAANLQTALKAHGNYRHDARQMIARLNETLWTASAGDQFAAIFYCLIDPETGEYEYAHAGKVAALKSAARPIISDTLPLGTQPDDSYQLHRDRLEPGGALVMISEGLMRLAEPSGRRRCTLATLLDDTEQAGAAEIAEAVRSQMLAKLSPIQRDCTALIVKRFQ